jgi:hypothetical protein
LATMTRIWIVKFRYSVAHPLNMVFYGRDMWGF